MFDVIILANYPSIWLLPDFKSDTRTLRLSEFLTSFIYFSLSWCKLCGIPVMQNKKKPVIR